MDNSYASEGKKSTGKLTVFGHKEWFINNPRVGIYCGSIFLGTVARNEVKTFDVFIPATIQFFYSTRSTQVYINSSEMTVELSWDRFSGKLLANPISTPQSTPNNVYDIETTNKSAANKKSNIQIGKIAFFAFLGIIIVFSIIGIVGSQKETIPLPTSAYLSAQNATPTASERATSEENKFIVAADNETGAEFNITFEEFKKHFTESQYDEQLDQYGLQSISFKKTSEIKSKNITYELYMYESGHMAWAVYVNRISRKIHSTAILADDYYFNDLGKYRANWMNKNFNSTFGFLDTSTSAVQKMTEIANILYNNKTTSSKSEKSGDYYILYNSDSQGKSYIFMMRPLSSSFYNETYK